MKTILQVAQELKVPKLKVYRCIKKRFIETHQENGVIYLDEAAEIQIKMALHNKEPHPSYHDDTYQSAASDVAVIQLLQETIGTLKRQLEAKDQQIAELLELNRNQQVLLKQEQDKHRPFWQRLFLPAGKSTQTQ